MVCSPLPPLQTLSTLFDHAGGTPNARGEPRQRRERSGRCWRRLHCNVRPCHGDSALRFFDEACLDKMLIEGKSPSDAQFLHDKEGDAIRERVILVLMTLEIRPPFVKQCCINVNEL